jgi:cephalosporin-C deacetylase-like acetyl esterase
MPLSKISSFKYVLILMITAVFLSSCGKQECINVKNYYDYDAGLPLKDSLLQTDTIDNYVMQKIEYYSVHNKKVIALLSVPQNVKKPVPVIILLHGVGDRKTVDYIQAGHDFYIKKGYAVFRIDIANHGERIEDDYEFDFTGGRKFWTRDLMAQTVFDLRRGIDLINKTPGVDGKRIGFYGVSLGGFIGTVFCGVDDRVKVPVIALAGGGINIFWGTKALTDEAKNYFSIIDPLNFVEMISPRPLLMINASNDEIVPPLTSKRLYHAAKEPKNIIWYDSKHRDLPIDKAYEAGLEWYEKYL